MAKEYIDLKALEIELNHRLSFLMAENGEYDAYTSGFDECVDRVENFQSAFDVAPVVHGRWLNFVNDYSTAKSVLDCYYDVIGDWNRVCNCHVTHWMPLPEPPKEDNQCSDT